MAPSLSQAPAIQVTPKFYLPLLWVFKKEFAYPKRWGLGKYPMAPIDQFLAPT